MATTYDQLPFDELNAQAEAWKTKVAAELKSAAPQGKGRVTRKSGRSLSSSVRGKLFLKDGAVNKIQFRFNKYGVFVEKGVGKGRKIRSGRETPNPWYTAVIQKNLDELFNLVTEKSGDMAINSLSVGLGFDGKAATPTITVK